MIRAAILNPFGADLEPGDGAAAKCLPDPGGQTIGAPDHPMVRARSSAEEHFLDMEGVTGSIPVAPTNQSAAIQRIEIARISPPKTGRF